MVSKRSREKGKIIHAFSQRGVMRYSHKSPHRCVSHRYGLRHQKNHTSIDIPTWSIQSACSFSFQEVRQCRSGAWGVWRISVWAGNVLGRLEMLPSETTPHDEQTTNSLLRLYWNQSFPQIDSVSPHKSALQTLELSGVQHHWLLSLHQSLQLQLTRTPKPKPKCAAESVPNCKRCAFTFILHNVHSSPVFTHVHQFWKWGKVDGAEHEVAKGPKHWLRASKFLPSRSTNSHPVVHALVSIPPNLWGFKIGTCISFVWNAFSWLDLRAEGWSKEEIQNFTEKYGTTPNPFCRKPLEATTTVPESMSLWPSRMLQCQKESGFFEQRTSRNISHLAALLPGKMWIGSDAIFQVQGPNLRFSALPRALVIGFPGWAEPIGCEVHSPSSSSPWGAIQHFILCSCQFLRFQPRNKCYNSKDKLERCPHNCCTFRISFLPAKEIFRRHLKRAGTWKLKGDLHLTNDVLLSPRRMTW